MGGSFADNFLKGFQVGLEKKRQEEALALQREQMEHQKKEYMLQAKLLEHRMKSEDLATRQGEVEKILKMETGRQNVQIPWASGPAEMANPVRQYPTSTGENVPVQALNRSELLEQAMQQKQIEESGKMIKLPSQFGGELVHQAAIPLIAAEKSREAAATERETAREFQAGLQEKLLKNRLEIARMQTEAANARQRASLTQNRQVQRGLSLANQFDSDPAVKTFVKANEGYGVIANMPTGEKEKLSSADAQAMIYAFAKLMDPDSVVREGEYATVQKYSQSWLNAFGFNVDRVLAGSSFLSPDAIKAMKIASERKFKVLRDQYDSVYSQYKNNIVTQTGDPTSVNWIVDYSRAVSGSTAKPSNDPLKLFD